MKLSVIIVNYNVEHFLDHCLHSVAKAMVGIDGEVFVVDNNSVDGSVEMVKRKYPTVQCLANLENKGFSSANNQAIRLAKGEYVLLLNPDTVVEEDTFSKVLQFMDSHLDAGACGVRMIDGKGNFLPESKRALPTPAVAFYKIFGLSALFPRSKTFGKYHLGYLDESSTHQVQILSGAFMLIRRSVLEKIGHLDESFFMYGEDIDLSWRIVQSGMKNYYFADTRIIHYKGESTKKSSVNYVFVFYQAMNIFARKHFSSGNARLFIFLINLAVYLRAGAAIFTRWTKILSLPIVDAAGIFAGIWFIKNYYEEHFKYTEGGAYPPEFIRYLVPGYIFLWLFSIFLSGGYDKPIRLSKLVRGVVVGTGLILILYALLPESLRFSRVMIFLGAAWVTSYLLLLRIVFHFTGIKNFRLDGNENKRLAIVGLIDECQRVDKVIREAGVPVSFSAFVSVSAEKGKEFAGTLSQLKEVCQIYKVDEVIFCSRDLPAQVIMDQMMSPASPDIDFKIAPPESHSVIGSNSIDSSGDLYVIGTNAISKPVNKRNKRFFDLSFSLILLVLSPVLLFLIPKPLGFLSNMFRVFLGQKTMVGFHRTAENAKDRDSVNRRLPSLRTGILSPLDILKGNLADPETAARLNSLYARDYRTWTDLSIVLKAWRLLGKT